MSGLEVAAAAATIVGGVEAADGMLGTLFHGVVGQLKRAYSLHKHLRKQLEEALGVAAHVQLILNAVPGLDEGNEEVQHMQGETANLKALLEELLGKEEERHSTNFKAAKSAAASMMSVGPLVGAAKKDASKAAKVVEKFTAEAKAFRQWLTFQQLVRIADKCPSNVQKPVRQLWQVLFGGKGGASMACSVLLECIGHAQPCGELGPLGRREWRRRLLGHDEGSDGSEVSVQRLETLLLPQLEQSRGEADDARLAVVLKRMLDLVGEAAAAVEAKVRKLLGKQLGEAALFDPFERASTGTAKRIIDLYFDLPVDCTTRDLPGAPPTVARFYETIAEQWVGELGPSMLLLEGMAGQGKSSSLRYLAQKQRKEATEAAALSDVRIPIFIHLPTLVCQSDSPLQAAMARQLFGKDVDTATGLAELEVWLHRRRFLLVLDSLLEVLFSQCSAAPDVLTAIRMIPDLLNEEGRDVRVVLSSRPIPPGRYDLCEVWDAVDHVVRLQPLDGDLRKAYINHVIPHLVLGRRVDAVTTALVDAADSHLSEMMETPLNIRLFVEVAQGNSVEDLPGNMWLLFKRSIKGAIRRELSAEKAVFSELRKFIGAPHLLALLLSFHREVASRLHRGETVTLDAMVGLLECLASEVVKMVDTISWT